MTRAAPLHNCDIGVDALTERLTAARVRSQLLQFSTTHEWLLFQRRSSGRFNNFFNISFNIFLEEFRKKCIHIVILTMVISKEKAPQSVYMYMLLNAYFRLKNVFVST